MLAALVRGSPRAARRAACARHDDPRECEELAEALGSRATSRVRLEHALDEEIWEAATRTLGHRPFAAWMDRWSVSSEWRTEAPWPSLATSIALHTLKVAGEKSASQLFLEAGGGRAWCRMQEEWLRAQIAARLSLYEVKGTFGLEDALAGTIVDLTVEGVPAGFVAKPGQLVLARPLVWRGESLLLPWDLDGNVLEGKDAASARRAAVRGDPESLFDAWYGAVGRGVEWLQ